MPHTLIIGGTRGLGRELARVLSRGGHQVSVIGRREPAGQGNPDHRIAYNVGDLTDGHTREELLTLVVTQNGALDYLVFCQRYRGCGDAWQGELDATLGLTKSVVEAAEGRFVQSGDKGIVVVSSVFADFVGDGQPISYHVGKAALNQMMRYYAVNLGRKGIRVNGVTPTTFLKDESRDFYLTNEPLHDLYKNIIPLGRMGTAGDAAQVIAFLCSVQSSFVNGQNIYVDGGLSLVWSETLARKLTSV